MPQATDPQSQIQFLYCCFVNSGDRKINFETVVKDLGLVSQGAAKKRFQRLAKRLEEAIAKKDKSGATQADAEASYSLAGMIPGTKRRAAAKRKAQSEENDNKSEMDVKSKRVPAKRVRKAPARKAPVKKEESVIEPVSETESTKDESNTNQAEESDEVDPNIEIEVQVLC